MKTVVRILSIGLVAIVAAGCASSRSGKVYSRDQAQVAHDVKFGIIEGLNEDIMISGTKTPIGTVAGGVMGGVLGNTVGGGSGKTIATAAGALAGAAAGTMAEEGITRKKAVEITVKLEDGGNVLTIVQEADEKWAIGQRVRVLRDPQGNQRVRPL